MKVWIIGLAVLATTVGCVRQIDIENQPASVTSVGPVSLDERQNVLVPFTVRDIEGDDQVVVVDVCDAPNDNCGAASIALGSDPLNRITTVPRDTDVLHEFRWQPWCGRWLDETLEPVGLDDEFVIAVTVLSSESDPVYSEPSSLAAMGAEESDCE